MKPDNLYLCRHGQSLSNSGINVSGDDTNYLSHAGVMQAIAAGISANCIGITRMVSSGIRRANQTAMVIASGMSKPIEIDHVPALREMKWMDRFYTKEELDSIYGPGEVQKRVDNDIDHRIMVDHSETQREVYDRVSWAMEKTIIPRIQDHEKVLIVSHFYSMRAIFAYLDGGTVENMTRYQIPNAIIYRSDQRPDSSQVSVST